MNRETRMSLVNTLSSVISGGNATKNTVSMALSDVPQAEQVLSSFNWGTNLNQLSTALINTLMKFGKGEENYLVLFLKFLAFQHPLTNHQTAVFSTAIQELTNGTVELAEVSEQVQPVQETQQTTSSDHKSIEVLKRMVQLGEDAKMALAKMGETW